MFKGKLSQQGDEGINQDSNLFKYKYKGMVGVTRICNFVCIKQQ